MAPVHIQIVTHNSAATIAACLAGVRSQTYAEIDVCVIDNASADDTCAIVEQHGVTLIRNDANHGYATAHNQGIRGSDADYVLTLNPDAALAPDFVAQMVQTLQAHPQVGMASGLLLRVESFDQPAQIVDSAGLMLERNRRQRLRYEGLSADQVERQIAPIFGPDGAAAFYRRAMLADIAIEGEVFDEDFFMHKEDVDLCWRAIARGWDAIFVPAAICQHIRGFRPGRRQQMSDAVRFWSIRNRYLKLMKNERGADLLRDLPFILAYELLIFGYVLCFERGSLRAYADAWHLRHKMWHKRQIIQSGWRGTASDYQRRLTAGRIRHV